jgi:hypothetical protein
MAGQIRSHEQYGIGAAQPTRMAPLFVRLDRCYVFCDSHQARFGRNSGHVGMHVIGEANL